MGRLTIKNVGSPTRVKGVRYDHEGNVLARSIVGPVGFFNEVNRQIKLGEVPLPPTLSTGGGGMNMTADDFAGASNLLSPRTAAATGADADANTAAADAAEVVERRESPIRALIRSLFKVLGSPFADRKSVV